MLSKTKFFYINLEKDIDRRENIQILNKKLNLFVPDKSSDIQFERFGATHAAQLNVYRDTRTFGVNLIQHQNRYFINSTHRIPKRLISNGEMACALSHFYLCQHILNSPKYDAFEYFLILEDDSNVKTEDVAKFLQLMTKLPPSSHFDLCLLSDCIEYFPPIPHKWINDEFFLIQRQSFNMANAYILTRSGLRIIVDSTTSVNNMYYQLQSEQKLEYSTNDNIVKLNGEIDYPADDKLSFLHIFQFLRTISSLKRYVGVIETPSSIWNSVCPNEKESSLHVPPIRKSTSFFTMDQLGFRGRLGNQMFQFAFLKCLELRSNIDLKLDDALFSESGCRLKLAFKNVNYEALTVDDISKIDQTITEDQTVYSDHEETVKDHHTNIIGYFQNLKYFEPFTKVIRECFIFHDSIVSSSISKINLLKKKFQCDELIALHCRMGDILESEPSKRVYPLITQSFVTSSIDYILQLNLESQKKIRTIVFTDSLIECQDLIKHPNIAAYICGTDFEDMCMISNMENIILSSSTFSWFAAWLNNRVSAVIYQADWYNPSLDRVANINVANLFPSNWIKIESNS